MEKEKREGCIDDALNFLLEYLRLVSMILPRITGHQVKNYIMIQNEVLYEKQSKKKVLNRVSRKTGEDQRGNGHHYHHSLMRINTSVCRE